MSLASIDRVAAQGRWRNRPLAEKSLIGLGFLALAVTVPPFPGAVLVTVAILAFTFAGARVSPRFWVSSCARPWRMRSPFIPTIITDASSIASGRSCASRMFSAGKFNIDDSSEIVPLSESTALAFIWSER